MPCEPPVRENIALPFLARLRNWGGIAMGQEIRYDEVGNVVTGSFMDFFMPTAVETPHWETDFTVTPSPHHPIGAKGVDVLVAYDDPQMGLRLGLVGEAKIRHPQRVDKTQKEAFG